MAVNLANPVEEGNSPTPKVDIPLTPTSQLTDMMQFMKNCMEEQSKCLGQQLEPILTHIQHLEQLDMHEQIPDYTHNKYNTWMAPHIKDDYWLPHDNLKYKDLLPTHIDNNTFMAELEEHDKLLNAEHDAQEVDEEEYHT